MKTTAWKVYMDYEKEEVWLNSMAAKGFALTDYFLFRYVFEDCRPGEYIYRLELLENLPTHAESRKYLNFLADNGVEHVTSWLRWVYLRKRAEDGSFDLYSDIDSRIAHYKRIATLWLPIMLFELMIGFSNFFQGLDFINGGGDDSGSTYQFIMGIVLIGVGAFIFFAWNSLRLKTRRLRREKTLRE